MENQFGSIVRMLFTCVVLALPVAAHAFKIDAHLWVAQQVYNDVMDDGQITIKLHDRPINIPVSREVVSALSNYKDAFMMGSIGPDALPDVVAGQMLVHPGNKVGWKTNDWLTYLLDKSKGSPLGTALAYGYMTHASADIFSHTYVNQYAGDVFILSDGETLVEQRHVALETYIGKHLPPYLDQDGSDLGPSYLLVTPRADVAAYIRDVLIYDPQVTAQYSKSGSTKHLAAYVRYRNAIQDAANNNDVWKNLDVKMAGVFARYYGVNISPAQIGTMIDKLNNSIIPAIQAQQNLGQNVLDELAGLAVQVDNSVTTYAEDQVSALSSLQAKIDDLFKQQLALGQKQACSIPDCPSIYGYTDPACREARNAALAECDKITRTNALIDSYSSQISGVRDQQLATAKALRDRAETIRNASQDMANRLFDLAQIASSNTSPVKAILGNWIKDLDVAMVAYVQAATNTMINTMNPAAKNYPHGVITPMFDWFDCYHRSLAGLPAVVSSGQCGFQGQLDTVTRAFDDIVNIANDATSLGTYINPSLGLPTPAEIRSAVDSLTAQAKKQLTDAAINEVKDLVPDEIKGMLDVLNGDGSDSMLSNYYSSETLDAQSRANDTLTGKHLLAIDDIAQRIKSEMNLTALGTLDPEKYAVVYDAVVLAKLSLLDNAGLAQLAQEAGVPSKSDGTPLFEGVDNVVAHSVASIDGNHQWMSVAAPYPNSVGAPYRLPNLDGYPWFYGYSSAQGMTLWAPEARSTLFRGLFIGPLTPGIDSPEEIHMASLLKTDYPYRPCKEYPFPNDTADYSCHAIRALPAIFGLLLD